MRPALRLLAAPVSGALLAAAFPTLDIGPLALVALVPLLLVVEYATRFHLGLSTPRALLAMTASGYLSPVVAACLTLAAASAAQVGSVITGRYSPAHPPYHGYN